MQRKTNQKRYAFILIFALIISILPIENNGFVSAADEVLSIIYSENFESCNENERPAGMEYSESAGTIAVTDVNGNKALNLKVGNDISYTTATIAFEPVRKKTVEIELKFMQPRVKANGNKILTLSGGGADILSVETNGGNISVRTASGYEVCVAGYYANKWYSLDVKADLFSGIAEISVDGGSAASCGFLNAGIELADTVSFQAIYSPGFMIDDISIGVLDAVSDISIEGEPRLVIPNLDEALHYEYTAIITDVNGQPVRAAVDWEILPPAAGVTVSPSEDIETAIISVANTAAEADFALVATVRGSALSYSKPIILEKLSASDAVIEGSGRVASYGGNTLRFSYHAAVYDQLGNTVADYGKFNWSLQAEDGKQIPGGITIDSNGTVSVTGNTPPREFIYICAKSVDNPDIDVKKRVLVTDYDSYRVDEFRVEAVKAHIDSVLEAARDTYGGSPLLGSLIHRGTRTIGLTPFRTGENKPLSNLATQANLMRAMMNLSKITGDHLYEDRVYDIYQYQLDNLIYNGYLIWDAHMMVDLQTQFLETNSAVEFGYTHEMKACTPFWDPFFKLDEEKAKRLVKHAFIGHAKGDLKDLILNRHATAHNYSLSMWDNPGLFDKERQGPIIGSTQLTFLGAYAQMFNMLSSMYKMTGDELARVWVENTFSTMIQSAYDPEKKIFNEVISSPYSEQALERLKGSPNGLRWYEFPDYRTYATPAYGDRWYNNVVLGEDGKNWVDMGLITEEQAKLMLDPYKCDRENSCITAVGSGICQMIRAFDADDPVRAKILSDYTISIYNYLNLRFNWEDSHFKPMMSWGLDMTGWTYPHTGYYNTEGKPVTGKTPEVELIVPMAQLVSLAVQEPELAEMAQYIWSVLRRICDASFDMGDIGDPFADPPVSPRANYESVATHPQILYGFMEMYKVSKNYEYLDIARNIANNVVATKYSDADRMFCDPAQIMVHSSNPYLALLLELDALILDDYDNLIVARTNGNLSNEFFDFSMELEDGRTTRSHVLTVLTDLKQEAVLPYELLVEKEIAVELGDKAPLKYSFLPYDAVNTAVYWEVDDKNIVRIDDQNGYIYGVRKGVTKIKCVSQSVLGLESPEITVVVY